MKKFLIFVAVLLVSVFPAYAGELSDADWNSWLAERGYSTVAESASADMAIQLEEVTRFAVPQRYAFVVEDTLIKCFGPRGVKKANANASYEGQLLWEFTVRQRNIDLAGIAELMADYEKTGGRLYKSPSRKSKNSPLGIVFGLMKLAVPIFAWSNGWTPLLEGMSHSIGIIDGGRAVNQGFGGRDPLYR